MRRGRPNGFTLVEVVLGATILSIVSLATLSVMGAAQDKLDEIWNLSRIDFDSVYETFASSTFDVEEMDAVGTVVIFNNEATARALLDLDLDLDLDRNGVANENVNKAAEDLRFLPVRIHLEWQTPFGVRTHDLDTFVYNREEE